MKLISASTLSADAALPTGAVQLSNDADPMELPLEGVSRIDLHFPKFTDGRAFSQAFLLRRRREFKGEIRATGDVLADQLAQMQRSGFDVAVLRADQPLATAERVLAAYPGFGVGRYQGDAVQVAPHFAQTEQTAKASPDFAEKLAETTALLRRAQAEFAPLTQASSLGAEDMVITHLLTQLGLDCSVFVLDTGVLHAQTVDLIGRIEAHYSRKVEVFRPAPGSAEVFVAANGAEAMYQSIDLRKACCGIRKLEPLGRALAGKKGWLTGLRREQSQARAEVEFIEVENTGTPTERAKINPLARWTAGDVWHFIGLNAVPYNPLHDAFFPSIGCAPCTRAVTLGEDIRSGRWWWEQASAKECGLHVASDLASVNPSLSSDHSVIPSKAPV